MTEEKVLEALKSVTYPGFTKDIVTFWVCKRCKGYGGQVTVLVDITFIGLKRGCKDQDYTMRSLIRHYKKGRDLPGF